MSFYSKFPGTKLFTRPDITKSYSQFMGTKLFTRPSFLNGSSVSDMPQVHQQLQSVQTNADMSTEAKQVTVCVFCGASPGTSPAHLAAARSLAQYFHKHNINLVYGGGGAGLMGELSRTLVSLSGPTSVQGIIPHALLQASPVSSSSTTISHNNSPTTVPDPTIYGNTLIVPSMHARKQEMAKRVIASGPGSGFVALSGGYGTLEELMEVTTWNQLGIHDKPVVVFNVEGYWDGLLAWVNGGVEAGFVNRGQQHILVEAESAEEVGERLRGYVAVEERLNLDWSAK